MIASSRGERPMKPQPVAGVLPQRARPVAALGDGAGRRCSPRASQSAETAKVAPSIEQRRRRVERGDQRPGREEADHLGQLQA